MYRSLILIRIFFILFCIFVATAYATTGFGGLTFTNIIIGLSSGLVLALGLIAIDLILARYSLRAFNTLLIGLLVGYFMGQTLLLIINTTFDLAHSTGHVALNLAIFLPSLYLGMVMTVRSTEELFISVPFVKFKALATRNPDILIDGSVLLDSRILDIACSGLVNDLLIVPRFVVKELYTVLEGGDENARNRAKRSLDVLKKLEGIPSLEIRYSEAEFSEMRDVTSKLIQLARSLDASVMTSDISRLQQYTIEGVRIINIQMLSNTLKPITGEQLSIKIQRYGKEPRQGVGYLEDGTMVVVNGGADFIGDTIRAHVLSVKHTSSGRMIFCNALEEIVEPVADLMESSAKNYFATQVSS